MQRKHPGWICLVLTLATWAVYWPVRHYDFVNYDDSDYVTANKHVLAGLKWDTLSWALSTGHASNWHPLTWLSHALDCQLFGPGAGAPHLVNLGFHILNTLLLFLLLRRLTGAYWRGAVVAALFALHPLHVESVAWVSERKDVLSAFFFLLTLGAYAAYAARGSRLQYVLALVFFALGLMSKPMLVTLPFVLLLLDWWPLQRLRFVPPEPGRARTPPALGGVARRRKPSSSAGQKPTTSSPRPAPPAPTLAPVPFWLPRWGLLAEKLPFFALSAASCLVTFVVQRQGGAVSTVLPLEARFANALVSYARYLAKTFWPANLSVLYPHPGHWPVWQVIGSSLLLVGTSAAALPSGAPPALRRNRLAVVPRNPGAGNWPDPGRRAIHGRPLHVTCPW